MTRGSLPDTGRRSPFRSGSGFDWIWFLFRIGGRVRRRDFWLRFALPSTVIFMALVQVDLAAGGFDPESSMDSLSQIFAFLITWPQIAVAIKRLHDRDRSGWFLLIVLIPLIGQIWLLIELGFLRGTPGPNRFGPNHFGPKP